MVVKGKRSPLSKAAAGLGQASRKLVVIEGRMTGALDGIDQDEIERAALGIVAIPEAACC